MNFEYFYSLQSLDSIEIADIGNCYINAFNDNGDEYLLAIETILGFTTIIEVGPIEIGNDFSLYRNRFEYNDKKINKSITKFLNNAKYQITQAQEISYDEFKNKFNNLLSIL